MNKFIVASMCLIMLSLAFAEEEAKTEKNYEVTNVQSFLNIRSGPGTIYSILRAIPNTEKNITIIESKRLIKSTWVKIKHDDEYGWVNKVYLKVSSDDTKDGEMAVAEDPVWLTMSGVYALTNIEPKKGEGMDTHLLFQVESEQAKIIYDAIKTPEFTDQCTGAKAKKVGKMLCLHYPPQEEQDKIVETTEKQTDDDNVEAEESSVIKDIYECHFSINIMKQTIQQGIPCAE